MSAIAIVDSKNASSAIYILSDKEIIFLLTHIEAVSIRAGIMHKKPATDRSKGNPWNKISK
ncbi:hypothetical protein AwDysgo_19910 [Bacteroidales bacterium]|nr:hypothetical protein AwDysgo_19910 [Bacteroidales bacterium]